MGKNVYRCCNAGQCGSSFETAAECDAHEVFCTYEPPPPPPDPETQSRAS